MFPFREGQKRLFDKRDCARMKLILRGKRFGFSLDEIRQLLDLYRSGESQKPQFLKTYQIALRRLADLEQKRDHLALVIEELREQIKWGDNLLKSLSTHEETVDA